MTVMSLYKNRLCLDFPRTSIPRCGAQAMPGRYAIWDFRLFVSLALFNRNDPKEKLMIEIPSPLEGLAAFAIAFVAGVLTVVLFKYHVDGAVKKAVCST